jgi:ABC-2 type transport system permease protein
MKKLLAVIKREYTQRVRTKFFIMITVLGPVMLIVFTIVPGLLFRIKAGGDTRLAVVDQTEGMKLYDSLHRSLVEEHPGETRSNRVSGSLNANKQDHAKERVKTMRGGFQVQPVNLSGQSLAKIKLELNQKIGRGELDGYLVIPAEILENSEIQTTYYGRNIGDVITRGQIEDGLDRAVRRERLIANGVREEKIAELSEPVDVVTFPVNEKGEEGVEDSGAGFAMVFVIAFLIYITVLLYGQVLLGAIVEEKETRVAEVLFSSVKSSTLMVGKLIGVSLVAFTQMGIWILAFALISVFGVAFLTSQGVDMGNFNLPHLPPAFYLYFFLFFALGYFIFATLYVLIGSMVTTAQEGGQLAVPVVFVLMAGLYLAFPVIRSPNSSFAVWVSMVPFFSPITMIVRIVSQTPPLWQILLSLLIGAVTVAFLLWVSSRIYRIGMLMYGKKATIPEVIRWAKES